MNPLITSPEAVQNELSEARAQLRRYTSEIPEFVRTVDSLKALVSEKNTKIIRLEAENVRLKMTRTDKELSTQVDGLRIEVGKKDRELVDLRRQVETFKENERLTLLRATTAEQRTATFQNTLITLQAARDAADAKADQSEADRLTVVRRMVDAIDRCGKLDTQLLAQLKIVQAITKVLPLLPPNLSKSSKDVQSLLTLMKNLETKK